MLKLKDNLFYIGIVIFSLTLFVKHLFSIQSGIIEFIMGFGVGLELVGVVILIMKKRKERK